MPQDSAIKYLSKIKVDSRLPSIFINEFKDIYLTKIADYSYKLAVNMEDAGDILNAIGVYNECSQNKYFKATEDASFRYYICAFKLNRNIEILEKINLKKLLACVKGKTKYKEELAYRFALYLYNHNLINDCIEIINTYIPKETSLLNACHNVLLIEAENKIEYFNRTIESINDRTLPRDEAIEFGKSLKSIFDSIKGVKPEQNLKDYQDGIKKYALIKLYEEGAYDRVYSSLNTIHPIDLTDFERLRFIANVSLAMIESSMLNNDNYKDVISGLLTVIYQEGIFIDSLNYTSWDDCYRFTLHGALGHFGEHNYPNLDDNITFDQADDGNNVISIKAVQTNILTNVEFALNEEYAIFFNEQKNAMDLLISLNLDEKCILVAPYLATKSRDYLGPINKALDIDISNHYDNWEQAIKTGVLYNMSNGIYGRYIEAISKFDDCVSSLTNLNKSRVTKFFTSSSVKMIKEFENLFSELMSNIYSSFKLSQNSENKFDKIAVVFGEICDVIKDDSLNRTYSHYISQYVIASINNDSMTMCEGAKYLLALYRLNPQDANAKRNLGAIVDNLIVKVLSDNHNQDLKALDIITKQTRDFDVNIITVLSSDDDMKKLMIMTMIIANESAFKGLMSTISSRSSVINASFKKLEKEVDDFKIAIALNEIVEEVNNGTMPKSTALDKAYNLYISNQNNGRVCQNLSTLCSICIKEYIIPQKYGYNKIEATLNKLSRNKSTTFLRNNNELKNDRIALWNQLPLDAQNAIKYTPSDLNDNGRALVNGFAYYDKLS